MELWLLVFLFKGAIYASGPHEAETCQGMAWAQPAEAKAVCIHRTQPRHRLSPKEPQPWFEGGK